MTQTPSPGRRFATFGQLVIEDPFELAAGTLPLVFANGPVVSEWYVAEVLFGLVDQQGGTFLGLRTSLPMEIRVTRRRCIAVWERALVAATEVTSADDPKIEVILLDPAAARLPYSELLDRLRRYEPMR